MTEITELKKQIINYVNTKEVYSAYKESGYSAEFYTGNVKDILLHQSAKQAFNLLSKEQIPTIKNLHLEFQECLTMKISLMKNYKSAKSIMKQSVVIKNNINLILGASDSIGRKSEQVL